MVKFRKFIRNLFRFMYNRKSSERQRLPIETTLKMMTDSSDLENANIQTDSSSSQEHLIENFKKPVEEQSSESSSDLDFVKFESYEDSSSLESTEDDEFNEKTSLVMAMVKAA